MAALSVKNNTVIENSSQELMTVKEIASELHIAESTVKNTIQELRQVLGEVCKNNYGGYLLNEVQATAIKMKLRERNNLKDNSVISQIGNDLEFYAILKRREEEQKVLDAYRDRRIAELTAIAEQEKVNRVKAEQKVIELTPDAENWKAVQDSDGTFAMTKIANTLNFKAKDGFNWFSEYGYIAREQNNNGKTGKWLATDKGMKSGFVRNVVWVDKENNHAGLSMKLTTNGVSKIIQLIKDNVIVLKS